MVRRVEASPKGEGSMRRYFCGDEAKEAEEEEAAAEDKGAQRLRFGEAGLSRGSKSRVRFKVAPQAMAEQGRGRQRRRKQQQHRLQGRPGLPHTAKRQEMWPLGAAVAWLALTLRCGLAALQAPASPETPGGGPSSWPGSVDLRGGSALG